MKIAIHVTHEALKKIGGIGAVLNGACTSEAYRRFFGVTMLYGPLFEPAGESLRTFVQEGGELLYSNLTAYDAGGYETRFTRVIDKYGLDIVYGRRLLSNEYAPELQSRVDILLVGTIRMPSEITGRFRYFLWEKLGIRSDLYEDDPDYAQYVNIAVPLAELRACCYGSSDDTILFAHEYMGLPSAFAAHAMDPPPRTIFVAHEVATARTLVERLPGHDLSFYNILNKTISSRSLEEVFGCQQMNPRHVLISRATSCDLILAVGELVQKEYRYLVPSASPEKLRAVFHGIPVRNVSPEEKRDSRNLLDRYIRNLLGFKPDVLFTHVSRLVTSKGIWRDITLLSLLDELFHARRIRGVYLLLSTLIAGGRSPEDVLRMEGEYGWPREHREGWPDLVGAEMNVSHFISHFNQHSKAIKGIFINQFGFDTVRCGTRVPPETELVDLRIASDAELGFSVYEPFGIAQIETLPFGGVALLSSVCGSVGFIREVFSHSGVQPFHVVDFIGSASHLSVNELMRLSISRRDELEHNLLTNHAKAIFFLLPFTWEKRDTLLHNAHRHLDLLSWDNAVTKYLLPQLSTL